MRRARDFGAGLRFAALAALAAVAALVALEPFIGGWRARAVFALLLLPVAGARCAESLGARARAFVGLALASLALGWAHLPWPALALPPAGAFGVARAVSSGRGSPARALGIELVLLGGGLALGALCLGHGALSYGLAVWAFLLVQAAFPLFAAGRSSDSQPPGDPFERARDQALALLEREAP